MSTALPSYGEAAALVAEYAAGLRRAHPPIEQVGLAHAAGRILAQPLMADADQPPFARSTRDGFACRAHEAFTHRPLTVAGLIRAGDPPSAALPPAAAWEIMTGAPIPDGADAVMMIEHVERCEDQVRLLPPRALAPGENIVARAAQARAGDELLPAGIALGFAQIALAASCGAAALPVYVRPRVAILSTGDELVPIGSTPAPGQIRNSSAPMLAALVASAGGDPWVLPIAADTAESLRDALAEAAQAHMLLVTGGVSAGKFDLVEPALARAGARFHFTGVRIQPGKPLVFAEMPRAAAPGQQAIAPVFGLPGNPVSSAVTFLLFAAPVVAALAGSLRSGPRFVLARLAAQPRRHARSGLTRFLPAHCDFSLAAGPPQVSLIEWQGSGDLAALARSNCFLFLPENDHPPLEPGAIVPILLA